MVPVRFKTVWVLFISIFLLAGCTVTLVSKYDEQTDANVTNLQKRFDAYFIELQDSIYPGCTYAANAKFYKDVNVLIDSAMLRARAIPKNEITVQQLDSLAKATFKLEQAQKSEDSKAACLSPDIVTTSRTAFNSIFFAILKFELAKKRGDS